jgi:hypothetical protein
MKLIWKMKIIAVTRATCFLSPVPNKMHVLYQVLIINSHLPSFASITVPQQNFSSQKDKTSK